jgi:DNA-binding transcriptional MerR regulator
MATTYSISDLAREFDLTTRAIRFYEDMGLLQPERSGPGGRNRVYSHRDRTLQKFLVVLADHKRQLEEQMAEIQANLDEVKVHEKEARNLLAKQGAASVAPSSKTAKA